eukprot:1472411-Pyramimonas_sp.AAC.1
MSAAAQNVKKSAAHAQGNDKDKSKGSGKSKEKRQCWRHLARQTCPFGKDCWGQEQCPWTFVT